MHPPEQREGSTREEQQVESENAAKRELRNRRKMHERMGHNNGPGSHASNAPDPNARGRTP